MFKTRYHDCLTVVAMILSIVKRLMRPIYSSLFVFPSQNRLRGVYDCREILRIGQIFIWDNGTCQGQVFSGAMRRFDKS